MRKIDIALSEKKGSKRRSWGESRGGPSIWTGAEERARKSVEM